MKPGSTFRLGLATLALGATACGPAPATNQDRALYDPDWILDVEIRLDPADWDQLRRQARSFDDVFCNPNPPVSPFTLFPADITIDGVTVRNVGVRKKCFFGSCNELRPSLKVAFNEYVRGQRFFGTERLTLNNAISDPSLIKQCLGYWLFDRAGVVAPRCNFARVRVNGEDLELYVHVEGIDQAMIARHFKDARGDLYEGALSDFQPSWVGTFQKKTNQENPGRAGLAELVAACQAPDDQLVAALERQVDLDRFLSFWAMEVLIGHWDGYSFRNHNNYSIYRDPETGRFHFIPWGIDGIFFEVPGEIRSVFAEAILPQRLYQLPRTQAWYLERLQALLTTVWDVPTLQAEIDRMERLITPFADPYHTGALQREIDIVRAFVDTNADHIRAELTPAPPVWNRPLSDPPCLRERGMLAASFDTRWGTLNGPNPFGGGSGRFALSFDGAPVGVSLVAANAGYNPNPPPGTVQPVVQIIALVPGVPGTSGDTLAVAMIMINDPALVAPGKTVPLDMSTAVGVLVRMDPAKPAGSEEMFLLMGGSLVFEAAATVDGAPIRGSLQASVRESGW